MKPQQLLFSIAILFWLSIVSNEVKGQTIYCSNKKYNDQLTSI